MLGFSIIFVFLDFFEKHLKYITFDLPNEYNWYQLHSIGVIMILKEF